MYVSDLERLGSPFIISMIWAILWDGKNRAHDREDLRLIHGMRERRGFWVLRFMGISRLRIKRGFPLSNHPF